MLIHLHVQKNKSYLEEILEESTKNVDKINLIKAV